LLNSFLRLGVTAFGGPSMVAYIRKLAVEKRRWLDAAVFSDGVALCQMIPGATAMQTAALFGLKVKPVGQLLCYPHQSFKAISRADMR
jgi:chromate transporter